jgi:hypothetical protein
MKKKNLILLTSVLVIGLTACGSSNSNLNETSEISTEITEVEESIVVEESTVEETTVEESTNAEESSVEETSTEEVSTVEKERMSDETYALFQEKYNEIMDAYNNVNDMRDTYGSKDEADEEISMAEKYIDKYGSKTQDDLYEDDWDKILEKLDYALFLVTDATEALMK